MTQEQINIFAYAALAGFSLTLIIGFAGWGISKIFQMFASLTER